MIEQSIVNKASEMTEEQLDTVEEMFKIYKTEGFKEKRRYEILCKNFRGNIEKINKQAIRKELMEEYIRLLDEQFMKQYDPKLVQKIKQR